jgi:putative transcriptional regulator
MVVFNKAIMINQLVEHLLEKRFQVHLNRGCFDIAARRDYLMLIKGTMNIDGMTQDQATSLRAISYFLSAFPLVISIKSNREFLNNHTIYNRFELPVVTPELFKEIIDEEHAPYIKSAKGRHTVVVDAEELRKQRLEKELTLQELADMIGISKKALYEIEKKRVDPTEETAKKIESVLKKDLKKNYEMETVEPVHIKPKGELETTVSQELNRMGIDNSVVHSAPFDIVGKEKFSLITCLSKNTLKIKRTASNIKQISSFLYSKAVFVAKKTDEKSVDGIPVMLESELHDIQSSKELGKIIDETEESE